jgi:hypothetical protein
LEISNVIEDNFIFQRYFSSYTLIKYSLLNVLAMTREIESKIINNQKVIQIICDFCEITKLNSKKYINIYLNIFKAKYQNKELREKLKIKECLNQIMFYSEKKNLFLSEENEKFLNDVKQQVEPSEISSNDDDFKEFDNKKGKFFEIKSSIFSFGKSSNFENAIKTIETIYLGKYEDKIDNESKKKIKPFDFNYNELYLLYKNTIDNKSKNFFPKTPILLYDSTNKILKKYLTNFSYENIPYKDLLYDIISLLFYFKIPNIGYRWIDDKKKKKDEELLSKSIKNKVNNKEKKQKSDKKRKKGEEQTPKSINNGESINDEISENETSQINEESVIDDGNWAEIERKNIVELNEVLIKIISILYDLYNNIKEKYKSQNH